MKVIISGVQEHVTHYLKKIFEHAGHEVSLLSENSKELQEAIASGVDALVYFPKKISTSLADGMKIRDAIASSVNPPKVFVALSSLRYYPKGLEKFWDERDFPGKDPSGRFLQNLEESLSLPEGSSTRTIFLRLGFLLGYDGGFISAISPFFKMGLGSVIGRGHEPFPWISVADLSRFILYAVEKEGIKGAFNMVAPQLVNTKEFSKALAKVLHKHLFIPVMKRFFYRKLGENRELIFAKSKFLASKILETGFEFRYPAVYPALVDIVNSSR